MYKLTTPPKVFNTGLAYIGVNKESTTYAPELYLVFSHHSSLIKTLDALSRKDRIYFYDDIFISQNVALNFCNNPKNKGDIKHKIKIFV